MGEAISRRGMAVAIGAAALVATTWGATASAEVFEVADGRMLVVRNGVATADASLSGEGDDAMPDAGPMVAGDPPAMPAGAVTLVQAPPMPAAFGPAVLAAAGRYQVSPALLGALVWQESRWRADAISAKGATGLAQLMPATARALAVDPRDAAANLSGAAHYLRQLLDLFDGDVERALAAYNAGPARVLKAGGVPAIAETRAYVAGIMARLAATSSPAIPSSSSGGTTP